MTSKSFIVSFSLHTYLMRTVIVRTNGMNQQFTLSWSQLHLLLPHLHIPSRILYLLQHLLDPPVLIIHANIAKQWSLESKQTLLCLTLLEFLSILSHILFQIRPYFYIPTYCSKFNIFAFAINRNSCNFPRIILLCLFTTNLTNNNICPSSLQLHLNTADLLSIKIRLQCFNNFQLINLSVNFSQQQSYHVI